MAYVGRDSLPQRVSKQEKQELAAKRTLTLPKFPDLPSRILSTQPPKNTPKLTGEAQSPSSLKATSAPKINYTPIPTLSAPQLKSTSPPPSSPSFKLPSFNPPANSKASPPHLSTPPPDPPVSIRSTLTPVPPPPSFPTQRFSFDPPANHLPASPPALKAPSAPLASSSKVKGLENWQAHHDFQPEQHRSISQPRIHKLTTVSTLNHR